jgi:hypothetical protein
MTRSICSSGGRAAPLAVCTQREPSLCGWRGLAASGAWPAGRYRVATARVVTAADGRLPHAARCTTVPPGHRPNASHVLPLYRPCTARQVPVRAHRRPGPAGRRLHLRHWLCAGSRHLGAPAAAASHVCSGSWPTCFLSVNRSFHSSFLFLPKGLLHLVPLALLPWGGSGALQAGLLALGCCWQLERG